MKAVIGFHGTVYGMVSVEEGKLVYEGRDPFALQTVVERYLQLWERGVGVEEGQGVPEEFIRALPTMIGAGYLWCNLQEA